MPFSVVQAAGAAAGNTTVTFSQATTAGNLLIIFDTTNSAGDTASASGHAATLAVYTPLYGSNSYHAIFYIPNCPGGLTTATVSGTSPYTVGYMEVSGADTSPTVTTGQNGSNTPVTTWSLANPAASSSQFTVFGLSYDVSNGGTPHSDGFTDYLLSNFGQFSYTTTAGASAGSFGGGDHWAGAAASFTPPSGGNVSLTADAVTLATPLLTPMVGPDPFPAPGVALAAPVPALTFGAASIPLPVAQVTLAAPPVAAHGPPAGGQLADYDRSGAIRKPWLW